MNPAVDLRIELRELAARIGPNVTLDPFCSWATSGGCVVAAFNGSKP